MGLGDKLARFARGTDVPSAIDQNRMRDRVHGILTEKAVPGSDSLGVLNLDVDGVVQAELLDDVVDRPPIVTGRVDADDRDAKLLALRLEFGQDGQRVAAKGAPAAQKSSRTIFPARSPDFSGLLLIQRDSGNSIAGLPMRPC